MTEPLCFGSWVAYFVCGRRSGRLLKKGFFMTNIAEFYAAGLGFSIVGCDAHFEADGELSHCRTISNLNYKVGGAERTTWDNLEGKWLITDPDPKREALTDTSTLNDDGDRWAHVRDAHHADALSEAHTLSFHDVLWDKDGLHAPVHGEMQYYARERLLRFERLKRFISKQGVKRYAGLRRTIWSHYRKSIAICAKNGEWYLLLLTKVQVTVLMDLLR